MVSIKISTISTTLTIAISSRFPTRTKTVVVTSTTVVGTTETSLLRTVVLATVTVETTVTRTPTTTLTFATTSYETGAPPPPAFLPPKFAVSIPLPIITTTTIVSTVTRTSSLRTTTTVFPLSDNRRATFTTVIITPSPLPDTSCGNSGVNVWLYNSPFSSGPPNTNFEPSVLTNLAPYGTTIAHMIGFSSAEAVLGFNEITITIEGGTYLPIRIILGNDNSAMLTLKLKIHRCIWSYLTVTDTYLHSILYHLYQTPHAATPALKSPSITIPFQGLPIISQISTLTGLNQIHLLIKTSLRISVLQPRRRQIPLDSYLTASYSRSILVVIFTRLRLAVILLTSSGHADDYALIWTGAKAVTGFKANNNDTYGHHPSPDGSYVADLTAGSYLPLNLDCCMGVEAVSR
ncbi:hypothetical protein EYR41_011888 [Orbilia oligospora]|uniref:GLEYA adhesin domain-containing protein n=1 Tax=Orbilia oligospora TaxID=2813651 RepID=A0A8H2HIK7_ORBOL|nr:hypothetical protein TWF132_006925 [Orbilia oligospora]TGJ62700.1 hypothetical protein EYR41_011888 [Orbilia oligospora]